LGIKGVICFLQRSPFPIGCASSDTAIESVRNGEKPKVPDLRETPAFKRLDAEIVAFRLSFPKNFKNVISRLPDGQVDTQLVMAHSLPHT
jgi:hypothetical protein